MHDAGIVLIPTGPRPSGDPTAVVIAGTCGGERGKLQYYSIIEGSSTLVVMHSTHRPRYNWELVPAADSVELTVSVALLCLHPLLMPSLIIVIRRSRADRHPTYLLGFL